MLVVFNEFKLENEILKRFKNCRFVFFLTTQYYGIYLKKKQIKYEKGKKKQSIEKTLFLRLSNRYEIPCAVTQCVNHHAYLLQI